MNEYRRRFLRTAFEGAGASLALAAVAPFRAAYAQPAPDLAAAALGGDLMLITGAGGNVVVLPGPDGLVLVDSGAAERSAALVDFLSDRFGGAPVRTLLNTHWHPECTGGNEAFGKAGARILAHENTRLWMSTEFYVDWQDVTYSPRPADALPTDTFYSHEPQPLKLSVGGRRIEYGHLPQAHTDGDIYVRFPDDDVIAAGGVMAPLGSYPIVDYTTGGWIGGLAEATRQLLELSDASTRIVPEAGPARSRADLEAQHAMLTTLKGRIEDLMRRGRSAEEMIAEGVTAEFDAEWGNNAESFVSNVYDGLWWAGRLSGSL